MLGYSVGWRLIAGAAMAAIGLVAGRMLRRRRRHLLDLAGLRNGQIAVAVGPHSIHDIKAVERLLSPGGHLVEIVANDIPPVSIRIARAVRLTSRLVCEPSTLPFRPQTFDAVVLVEWSWVEALVPLLKPSGLLSLAQSAGKGFRLAADRRNQLAEAGLEVIDSPGVAFSYVINSRRPIRSDVVR